MAYVDLNPIRAGIATTPEQSAYTSIRARLKDEGSRAMGKAVARLLKRKDLNHFDVRLRPLMRFADTASTNASDSPPMNEHEYFKLVDMTGRIITRGKRGYIDAALAPLLNRLGLSTDEWASSTTAFRQHYRNGDLRLNKVA